MSFRRPRGGAVSATSTTYVPACTWALLGLLFARREVLVLSVNTRTTERSTTMYNVLVVCVLYIVVLPGTRVHS